MIEIAFWQRESEALIGQIKIEFSFYIYFIITVYIHKHCTEPVSQKSTTVNGIKNIMYSASQGSLS